MPFYYKSPDGGVHFLEDSNYSHTLPNGSVHITEEEALELLPKPPKPTYKELRAAAYPPIYDYMDAVVKGETDKIQAYIEACLAVKEKYPKTDDGGQP
jgi:hypothetical protein